MKKQWVIIITLITILTSVHIFMVIKLLPIINNLNEITTNINKDYSIIYNRVDNITINIETTINNIDKLIINANQVLNDTNKTLIQLNNTITNLNTTISMLKFIPI